MSMGSRKAMTYIWSIVAAFLFLSASLILANDVDLSLAVEQSFDGHEWTSRGQLKYVLNKKDKKLSIKFDQPTFTLKKQQLESLKKGWISVRIPAVDGSGNIVPGKYLLTSTKGCALLQDSKEIFSVLTDKTGALLGLQYDRPLVATCSESLTVPEQLEVTSKIVAILPKESPSLPVPRIDPESLSKGTDGKQKEDQPEQAQTFLQQYWYIILPSILVYTLLTAPQAPPEEPGQAQPGQSAAAGAAGAAVAGAVNAGGGAQVRRRKGGN